MICLRTVHADRTTVFTNSAIATIGRITISSAPTEKRSDAVPESRTLLGDIDRCTTLGGQGFDEPCYRAWGSFHNDTLNFALCDGSVQTFSIAVDMNIFADAATIAGREFSPLP